MTDEEKIQRFNIMFDKYGYRNIVEWGRAYGMYPGYPFLEGYFHHRAYCNGNKDSGYLLQEVIYWGA